MAVERVLGLDGQPPADAGLHLTESLLTPDAAIVRLEQAGVRIFTGEAPAVATPRHRFDRIRAATLT